MPKDPFGFIYTSGKKMRLAAERHVVIDAMPLQNTRSGPLRTPAATVPIRPLVFLVLLIAITLLARTFQLQIISGSQYRYQAEGNRIHTRVTKAVRGVFTDTHGELLVKNVPNFRLVLDLRDLPRSTVESRTASLNDIRRTAGVAEDVFAELVSTASTTHQPVVLREHIPYGEALQLMIGVKRQPGLTVQTFYSREYTKGDVLAPVLGYTGNISEEEYAELVDSGYALNDDVGKTGLEKSYENDLRGDDGEKNIEIDNRGKEKTIVSEMLPVAGNNLRLTIDVELQKELFNALRDFVDSRQLPGASAAAIDPRDGSVRALVSYPSYDNNLFANGISSEEYTRLSEDERQPLFHRAVAGTYPSGSTFKPVVAAAALEEGVITPNTTVSSTGGLRIDQYFFPDWKAGGHGITNVYKALAESVNTFFYLAGGGDNATTSGLGVERIVEYGKRFGLSSKTGIDLPGEAAGFLPTKAWKEEWKNEPWYIGDTYHLAIGQGDILVTPLQVAVYTSIFANGGTYYRPHLVQEITDQNGKIVRTIEKEIVNEQVVSNATIQVVRQGMRDGVLYGSSRSLASLPVTAAGKTGTAQFGTNDTHSWFTAFAPYETPELAVAVIVEKGGEGNDAAVPIVRSVFTEYFKDR